MVAALESGLSMTKDAATGPKSLPSALPGTVPARAPSPVARPVGAGMGLPDSEGLVASRLRHAEVTRTARAAATRTGALGASRVGITRASRLDGRGGRAEDLTIIQA